MNPLSKPINVTIWDEEKDSVGLYPSGIGNAIAEFLKESEEFGTIRTATLSDKEHGLTENVLNDTDVLLWWGHLYHDKVDDSIVERVRQRVLAGMGLIALHSSHASKIFSVLMGTNTKRLRYRPEGERERVWNIEPSHPIAMGIPEYFDIPLSEMYGEYFHIPVPDELIFISWFEGGEVFRSGCTFKRGLGRIFYFSPGHEKFLIYHIPEVQKIILNGIRWSAPFSYQTLTSGKVPRINKEP